MRSLRGKMTKQNPLKPWVHLAKEVWRTRTDGTIIVSYPKSGRTWHRAAIGLYLAKAHGLDERQALDTHLMTQLAGLEPASYSHNGANFLSDVPPQHYTSANGLIWRNHAILFLVRDPRAVLVSSYHHMKSRTQRFDGTLSEFVRHPYRGIEKILVAYNRWHDLSQRCPRFMLQTYEGMHRDHRAALASALRFLGVSAPDARACEYAIEMTAFGQLKKLEADGFFQHKALNKRERKGAEKVRAGTVDSYSKELSEDDLRYIADVTQRIGNPFANAIANAEIDSAQVHSRSSKY